MELVRHFTRIPVPVIYAYDSSSDNKLNLEWMLMEKVSGEPLTKRWLDLDEASQTRIVQQVADWENDLSKITSSQIGGIISIGLRRTSNSTSAAALRHPSTGVATSSMIFTGVRR